ncbi:hypothetical protein HGQ98_31645 [Achromobacter ruhlandii]|uniref:Uncharacterized protein n=1 Tax=Achromobacter ruhlandii TaxID=72557 RepID=A0A848NS08_9BURK|nr:hypothetical protein [Achromobacter ruhlandii]NMU93802.1 hypothetical protein [Achromobacter ruhlandii]
MSFEILRRTPLWVWALFAFLLYRGIRALRPRQVSVTRTFLLPVLFLVWALVSIHGEVTDLRAAYEAFFAGVAAGGRNSWNQGARVGRGPASCPLLARRRMLRCSAGGCRRA